MFFCCCLFFNSVYYLNVPYLWDNYEYKPCGKILFYDRSESKWKSYQPEPYELLIMPNYLDHETEYHKTEEHRISLNFEIICDETINWDPNYFKRSDKSLYTILEL